MFEQTFKNIDDILHKDAGCSSELDYAEQTSWMLFLKYLDDLEHEKSLIAELEGRDYSHIIDTTHRWSVWAAPKDEEGKFDYNNALTGDDLIEYVDGELFPYLKTFKERAIRPDTIEYKIGETSRYLCQFCDCVDQPIVDKVARHSGLRMGVRDVGLPFHNAVPHPAPCRLPVIVVSGKHTVDPEEQVCHVRPAADHVVGRIQG